MLLLIIIINLFKTNLIVSMGISTVKLIQNILIGLSIGSFGYLGFCIFEGVQQVRLAEKAEVQAKIAEKEVYATKQKYTNIIDMNKELVKLYKSLPDDDEETIIARKILDACNNNIKSIARLQDSLNIILQRSEEYSLEEVINTINQAEETIGKNIFKITNRIVLELGVDGFDRTQIDKYLKNNIDILAESTKLVKEALAYIESKDDLDSNTIGIESLTETLQKLKSLNTKEVLDD